MFLNSLYYKLKPIIPRRLQIEIRRQIILRKRVKYAHVWPIDEKANKPPEGWVGWPDGKKFALVLTHDVETAEGLDKCLKLMELDKSLGFRSSFNFVAEDYRLFPELRLYLEQQGFEVGIHGLRHNVNLFKSKTTFQESAKRINQYLKDWQSVGFRAPSMYHNLDWIGDLDIEYDSSTFDTDPFEPQPDGVGTIFPFWVSGNHTQKGYIELPYTLPQDHSLFVIMGEKNIDIWKKKLDWIVEQGGMALLITHPDYMNFSKKKRNVEEYPVEYYMEFLGYIKEKYEGNYWIGLPRQVCHWYISQGNIATRELRKRIPSEIRIVKQEKGNKPTIWIDLDNSPHVLFFNPIIKELKSLNYRVLLTTRDCSQTCGLADIYCLEYNRVGKHYGKNWLMKVTGTVIRALQLTSSVRGQEPILALSHGSRAQILSALLLNIPSAVIVDYEHVKGLSWASWGIIPEIVSGADLGFRDAQIVKYPGIKEDAYVPFFKPDPRIKEEMGFKDGELVVTIRPPATEAHYHNPESEILFDEAINFIGEKRDTRIVLLSRNAKQTAFIKKKWSKWCTNGKIIIPENVVNGLNLIWHSDLVISGGGTMNREAATLGVPVYSIFRGRIGAVDRYLAESGRLTLIESAKDLRTKIILCHRHRSERFEPGNNIVLKNIVDTIVTLTEATR